MRPATSYCLSGVATAVPACLPGGPAAAQGHRDEGLGQTIGGWMVAFPVIPRSFIMLVLLAAGGATVAEPTVTYGRRAPVTTLPPVPAVTSSDASLADPRGDAGPDIGHVTACLHRSPFLVNMKLPEGSRVSTNTPGVVGFSVLVPDPKAGRIRPLVHGTWKAAGHLGQFTYDRQGNIYVVPVPLTSLEVNPLEAQNKVHILDAQTGRMREFIDLPAPRPIATSNPFGTIGLAYDCDTNSLYVASLAGSSASEELGTIFRVDLNSNQIAARIDGIDALGLGLFKGSSGKRLYFGLGRVPEVRSIAVDQNGDFEGESRRELSLADLGLPRNYRAQKIRFKAGAIMRLKALPFAYSLRVIGPEDIEYRSLRYLPGDRWEPIDSKNKT